MPYIDNDIKFNSFDSELSAINRKVGNQEYVGALITDLNRIASRHGGILPTSINALEIDWDSATLDKNITIRTTAQLLSLINKMLINFKTDNNNVDKLYFAKFQPDDGNDKEGTLII